MSRQELLRQFDRAVAALASHGHAQVMHYPYSVFRRALELHAAKDE